MADLPDFLESPFYDAGALRARIKSGSLHEADVVYTPGDSVVSICGEMSATSLRQLADFIEVGGASCRP